MKSQNDIGSGWSVLVEFFYKNIIQITLKQVALNIR